MASPTTTPARPTRQEARHLFGLAPQAFPTDQVSQALPVFWGRRYMSGIYLTPIFNDRAEAIKERIKAGKKSTTHITGYNYFGTYALGICFNEITEIEQIVYLENEILEAAETPVDANTPLTVETGVGDFVFYCGGSTQPIPTELADLGAQPGYRSMGYVVCNNIAFGTSPSPPNLQFLIKRQLNVLTLDAHHINGDAILAEVLYDLLTNTSYGLRIDPTRIEASTFEAIGNAMIAESHGLSPYMDEDTTARQLIGDLLEYSDLAIGETSDHKLQLLRIRDLTARTIDSNDLLERLVKEPESWSETFVETRVEFSDREAKGENRSVVYHDLAAEANGAQNTYQEFRRPFITQDAIASAHAIEIGRFGGVPEVNFKGELNSSNSTIKPGEKVSIDNNVILVESVEIAGPGSSGVRFSGRLDRSYLRRRLPGVTEYAFNLSKYQPAPATFRIAQLPETDYNGKVDGFFVAASRPNPGINAGILHWGDDLNQGWREQYQINLFALAAKIGAWRHVNGRNDALDITFDIDLDQSEFQSIVSRNEQRLLYVVTCYRDVIPPGTDQHSVMTVWAVIRAGSVPTPHATDPRRWLIDVESGYKLSKTFLYNTVDGSGRFPCERVFIGPEDAFHSITFDNRYFERLHRNDVFDTELKRHIKLQTKTPKEVEDFNTAPSHYYDRDDTTMNPDGTFVEDWNEASPPSHNNNLGDNSGSDPFQNLSLPTSITKYRDPADPVNDPTEAQETIFEAGIYPERI